MHGFDRLERDGGQGLSQKFGVQRQIAPSVVAVLQYVGSRGRRQSDDRQINTLPVNSTAREGVASGPLNAN